MNIGYNCKNAVEIQRKNLFGKSEHKKPTQPILFLSTMHINT